LQKEAEGFSLPFRLYLHPLKSRVTGAEKTVYKPHTKAVFWKITKLAREK